MMRNVNRGLLKAVIAGLLFLALITTAMAQDKELSQIRQAIKSQDALWTAGESWVTKLAPEERRALLGEMSLELGIVESRSQSAVPPMDAAPAAIDWRNKDGYNWITPIRDQQSCGSCVAWRR